MRSTLPRSFSKFLRYLESRCDVARALFGSHRGHLKRCDLGVSRLVFRVRNALRSFSTANLPIQPALATQSESPPQPPKRSMKYFSLCFASIEDRLFIGFQT